MLAALSPQSDADVEVTVGLHVEFAPQLLMDGAILRDALPLLDGLADVGGMNGDNHLHTEPVFPLMLLDVDMDNNHLLQRPRGTAEEEDAFGVGDIRTDFVLVRWGSHCSLRGLWTVVRVSNTSLGGRSVGKRNEPKSDRESGGSGSEGLVVLVVRW